MIRIHALYIIKNKYVKRNYLIHDKVIYKLKRNYSIERAIILP